MSEQAAASRGEMSPKETRRRFARLTGHPNLLVLQSLLGSRKAGFGAAIVLAIVVCAVAAPLLAPYDPNAQDLALRLKPLASTLKGHFHLLGTDQLGRDIMSRLIYGARVSLLVGLLTALLGGVVGTAAGLVAGYRGGWTDIVVMRLCDIQLALPYILVAIAVLALTGSSLVNIILILAATQWVMFARVVRGATLAEREKEYVLSARALGFGDIRIMRRYVLPNVFAPIIVIATFSVAQAVIAESALSFLGLGLPTTIPSWGSMLADGRTYLVAAWWLAAMPGLAITLTVIGINLLGDWLRDQLDPKLRL
jgi:peptide/nickel transport system permease protein